MFPSTAQKIIYSKTSYRTIFRAFLPSTIQLHALQNPVSAVCMKAFYLLHEENVETVCKKFHHLRLIV